MRYRVQGVDAETGRRSEIVLDAASAADAETAATDRGLTVTRIELDGEPGETARSVAVGANAAAPPETDVWRGTPSQWTNFPLFLLCLLILPIPYVLWRVVVTRATRWTLTTERLKSERGVFTKVYDDLENYRVRDITVRSSVWQRLVGIGDVLLQTSDRTHPEVVIGGVRGHLALRDLVRQQVEAARRRTRTREIDFE